VPLKKHDSNSLITDSEGYAKANNLGLQYFSVSAKTGNGVNSLFDYITKELIEKSKKINGQTAGIKLGGNQSYSKSWCC
jgi:predicted GTPase